MSNYGRRVDRLEGENLAPPAPLEVCICVFGDAEIEDTIEAFRAARNWPEDDEHSVNVTRVRWSEVQEQR